MAVTRTKRKMSKLKVMRVMVGLAAGPKDIMLCPAMLPLSDLTEPLLGFFGLVAVVRLEARRMMKKTRAARAMRQWEAEMKLQPAGWP